MLLDQGLSLHLGCGVFYHIPTVREIILEEQLRCCNKLLLSKLLIASCLRDKLFLTDSSSILQRLPNSTSSLLWITPSTGMAPNKIRTAGSAQNASHFQMTSLNPVQKYVFTIEKITKRLSQTLYHIYHIFSRPR